MTQTIHSDTSLPQLIGLGFMRSVGGFPVEHPLELIKLKAQANPADSTRKVFRCIRNEKGFIGLTDTMLTNFPRRVIRETLRWPVIGYTHQLLVTQFPRVFTKEQANSKFVTGLSVALFESVVILPIEQLMAYRVKEKERYTTFFKKRFNNDGIASIYRGFQVNFFRQALIWCTMMTLNDSIKRKFERINTEQIPPHYAKLVTDPLFKQLFTSVCIASVIVPIGLPVDFVKAQIQMNTHLQKKNGLTVAHSLFKRYGFSGFYAGASAVFLHTILKAALSGIILDKMFMANQQKH